MSKTTVKKAGPSASSRKADARRRRGGGDNVLVREAKSGQFLIGKARFEAVMKAAERSGLLGEKSGRIGGRISAALVEQAKRQTGIQADTDLIEFALASIALEDKFSQSFKASRGKVDPDLKLGF